MPNCLTGRSATLFSTDDDTKFSDVAAHRWQVRGISGGGRVLQVLDDSHLGQSRGRPLEKCFADLYEWEPFVVDVQLDTENTTLFEDINEGGTTAIGTNVYTNEIDNPVALGVPSANSGVAPFFQLELPKLTLTNAATLLFSGAIVRDSGYNLVTTDRNRITLTIQPDGKKVDWTVGS